MKIEVIFNCNDRYGRRVDKSTCGEVNLYLFHKHKSTQLNKGSIYKRFEFILNKCIYIKLI